MKPPEPDNASIDAALFGLEQQARRADRVDKMIKAAMIADRVVRHKMREADMQVARILAERIIELEDEIEDRSPPQ